MDACRGLSGLVPVSGFFAHSYQLIGISFCLQIAAVGGSFGQEASVHALGHRQLPSMMSACTDDRRVNDEPISSR